MEAVEDSGLSRLRSCFGSLRATLKFVNVEPALLLLMVAMGMLQTVLMPFLYWSYCVKLYYDEVADVEDFCHNLALQNGTDIQNTVEKAVVEFTAFFGIASALPPTLVTPLYGAWSDGSGGRKRPLLIALAGMVVALFSALVCTVNARIPIEYMLIGIVVGGLTGGVMIAVSSCFSTITDEAHKLKHAGHHQDTGAYISLRIGVASAILSSGAVVGSLLAASWQRLPPPYSNYAWAVGWAEIFVVIAFFYALFFVRESHRLGDDDDAAAVVAPEELPKRGLAEKARQVVVLVFGKYKQAAATIAKPRPGGRRFVLNTGLVLFFGLLCGMAMSNSVTLLYVKRAPFDWSDARYAYFTAYDKFVSALGMIFARRLLRKLLVFDDLANDTLMVMIALLSQIMQNLIMSFSDRSWILFAATTLDFFGGVMFPSFRALFSKLVDANETGRVFSAIGIVEHLNPVISGPLFNAIFAATFDIWTGFIFIISALVQTVVLAGVLFLHFYLMRVTAEAKDAQAEPIIDVAGSSSDDS